MTRMLYSALALATLAVVPARATVWNVTVGGTGLLAYTPNTIVCSFIKSLEFISINLES